MTHAQLLLHVVSITSPRSLLRRYHHHLPFAVGETEPQREREPLLRTGRVWVWTPQLGAGASALKHDPSSWLSILGALELGLGWRSPGWPFDNQRKG